MDPISALGSASAIITFIDFSWNLVSGTIEVHRNGRVNDDQDIGTIVSDLESITDDLRKRGPGSTRAERSIANLSEQCLATSQEIQKLLQPLMAKSWSKRTIWKSFKAQWAIMMGKEKIDELAARLQGYREQLMLNLGFLLREDHSSLNVQMRAVQDSFGDLNLGLSTKLTSLREDLIEAVKKGTTPHPPPKHGVGECVSFLESLETIKTMITHFQSSIVDMPVQQRIFRQLAYEEMMSRHFNIRKPEAGTLDWIFGQIDTHHQQSCFADNLDWKLRSDASRQYLGWLQEGTGVFHVSGNTGSGKSALMKYLAGHKLTKRKLELWAGTKTLVLADFYFWAPGNKLQQSLSGMRRSLLFGALNQHPELMEKVFPRQWRRMKASSILIDPMVEGIHEFGQQQIDDAFSILVESRDLSDYKFCFFIDALDELSGDRQDHEDLAEQICDWAKADNVKFCVSSRPYPEFKDIFRSFGHTIVYLHQLNKYDIYTYCREKFSQDRKGKLLPEKDRQELIEAIIEKSQGVFLWAFLVVRQLLNALRNDDPLHVLKKRLWEVLQQLEELYARALESVSKSKIDRTRAYRMLLLALENPFESSLDIIAFSWIPDFDDLGSQSLQDAEFPNGIEPDFYSDAEVRRRIERVIAQVRGLTRDFLEVSFDLENMSTAEFTDLRSRDALPKVAFFHRSARDYLLDDKIQWTLLHDAWPDFVKAKIYFKICLAEINIVPHEGDESTYIHRLVQYLEMLHRQKDGAAILRGLQTLGKRRGAYRHRWEGLQTSVARFIPIFDLNSDSLVHIAAHSGLDGFVLEEVDLNAGLLLTKDDSNILVSAAQCTRDYLNRRLVGKLLDRHADLDGSLPVVGEGCTSTERWPVWVIVSILQIQRLMVPYMASEDVRSFVRDLVRINQCAMDRGWNSAMNFKVWPSGRSSSSPNSGRKSRKFDFGEIVRFCETLRPEVHGVHVGIRWVEFLLGTTDDAKPPGPPRFMIHEVTWEP